MVRDVKNYISACETCKQCKVVNYITRSPMGKQVVEYRPWQRIYVDFLGPYPRSKKGHTHIIIVLDHFSRFVRLKSVRQATSAALVDYLENQIFSLFGVPETLVSDNGRQFESLLLKDLLKKYGVVHMFTPKYSPQSNTSERTNRSVLAAIRAYVGDSHQTWDLHLDEIAQALCNVTHESTGYSPHFLVFGQHYISHGSNYSLLKELSYISSNDLHIYQKADLLTNAQKIVLAHLKSAYQRTSERYNLRSRSRHFLPQQVVYIRNFTISDAASKYSAKLAPKFIKARIVKPVGSVAYEVEDEKGKILGIYHTKDIKS